MIQRRTFISSLVAAFGASLAGWRSKPRVGRFIAWSGYASKPVHPDVGIAVICLKQYCGLDPAYGRNGIVITISDGGGTGATATVIHKC